MRDERFGDAGYDLSDPEGYLKAKQEEYLAYLMSQLPWGLIFRHSPAVEQGVKQ